MKIFPAIDLWEGRPVRLRQGDFSERTDYGDDPAQVARGFADAGAKHLHVVDLSGAKDPSQRQTELIARLVAESGLDVQVGGGIRRREDVQALLAAGAARVVIGSLAVRDPELVLRLAEEFGAERFVVAIDFRADEEKTPWVMVDGWQTQSSTRAEEVIARFADAGIKAFLCTDISRDGMLEGCNAEAYETLLQRHPNLELQASGGVASLDDLSRLRRGGVPAVIVGKALYEGRFTLEEALSC